MDGIERPGTVKPRESGPVVFHHGGASFLSGFRYHFHLYGMHI